MIHISGNDKLLHASQVLKTHGNVKNMNFIKHDAQLFYCYKCFQIQFIVNYKNL